MCDGRYFAVVVVIGATVLTIVVAGVPRAAAAKAKPLLA